ncbi:hypothetical protein PRIPAC_89967 [Pristionchus pacificus]|uniref:Uncharacterized protein n=1 Tax=Pristionchus pacificus TaxID=54126 RepID=A0A2A6CUZ4_PRIPA|nr:hypothetical protein PRIPAC_89967 [Pristionchus pacificus]|eukprot:PDM82054.1 hypothetical protein PRIPAC_36447 [Pristionchus pacificus]
MLFTRALALLLLGLAALTSAFFTDKRKRFFTEKKRFLTGFGPSDGHLKFLLFARRGVVGERSSPPSFPPPEVTVPLLAHTVDTVPDLPQQQQPAMEPDENPYQAQFDQWDRFYRTVVLPQIHTLETVAGDIDRNEIAWSHYLAQLYDLDVDVPLTDREEYSEDFCTTDEEGSSSIIDRLGRRPSYRHTTEIRSRSLSETSSTFTAPVESSRSELHVNNQMHNKYALSPESSAYARELAGIFDDEKFANVDEPENLRITGLRDFCKSSIEDLRALPDPFPNKIIRFSRWSARPPILPLPSRASNPRRLPYPSSFTEDTVPDRTQQQPTMEPDENRQRCRTIPDEVQLRLIRKAGPRIQRHGVPMLSYAGHLLLSLALHVAGVTAGLTIWYLFPRNPLRTVVQKPRARDVIVPMSCALEASATVSPSSQISDKQSLLVEDRRKFA